MTVYYTQTELLWAQPDFVGNLVNLELFSMLSGELQNGAYYQTYF